MGKTTTTKKTTTGRRAKLPVAAASVSVNETDAKPKRIRRVAPQTNGAKAPAKKPATRKPKAKIATRSRGISGDDIALRAYFIGEHRRRSCIDGTPEGDWLEAERQLRAAIAV